MLFFCCCCLRPVSTVINNGSQGIEKCKEQEAESIRNVPSWSSLQRAVLWVKALKGSLGLKFALHLELRVKQATVGAWPSHFPSWGACPALLLTSPLGPTWLRCIRLQCGPWGQSPLHLWGGEGGRGGAGEQLGHSPSGTIHGEPSPNMQPLQPCLKVGCENGGCWTRMKDAEETV